MQGKVTNVHDVQCTSPSGLTGLLHVMYYMTLELFSSQRGTKLCGNPCPICRDDIKINYKVS